MLKPLQPLHTKSPFVDQGGLMTQIWVNWFTALYKKINESATTVLIDAKFASASGVDEYICPAGKAATITSFTATNNDSSSRTVSVHLVPSGGTPSDSNLIINAQSLAAGESATLTALTDQTLDSGDVIHVLASVASKVTIRCSGREVA